MTLASELLIWIGIWILVPAAVGSAFGVIAIGVGNERLGERIMRPAIVAMLLGLVVVGFGIFGWWLVGFLAVIGAFAYFARRTK